MTTQNTQNAQVTNSYYSRAVDMVHAVIQAPFTASNTSQMTDKKRVYVYTGSQSGYKTNHWYYWNGSAWTDGGLYHVIAADDAMSQTSTNAVQNRVVKAATDLKANAADISTLAQIKTYIAH